MSRFTTAGAGVALLATLAGAPAVHAAGLTVTVTNHAPADGVWFTPFWVGFHDGSFDVFDVGASAGSALEALAEDGNAGPLATAFSGAGLGGAVGAGPIAPGTSVSQVFDLATDGSNDFLSFAAMVLPSSDFFVGNASPQALSLSGLLDGSFTHAAWTIGVVYDAGTEVNDFATSAANGLFGIAGGQSGPNEGADQFGVVTPAAGSDYLAFLNLGGADVSGLDFDNYQTLATIEVATTPVPLPASLPLFGV
ncbi:MAG: spondin domain-containing protein, partial [Gammaproteobacteria bacterium]|nr:spondin domain-containing protein [Gammaproteobacteria bacterium]